MFRDRISRLIAYEMNQINGNFNYLFNKNLSYITNYQLNM